ncbi:hypothetical protein IT407_02365 [Candidatus Uhrbacteria bacterium]|nr:hypothetical protein [Candidatus Uhrbacteria bacterium]
MPQPLIPVGELVTSGWNEYIRDWKANLELSIRYLLAAVIMFVAVLVAERIPLAGGSLLVIVASIAGAAISLHTSILLTDVILKRDKGTANAKHDDAVGYKLFWSMFWISILVGLATLGGFILFVLPGIWLAVKFSVAQLSLIEDGKKGTEALSASSELVKGRWWGVFGRSLVIGFLVGTLAMIMAWAIMAVIGLFIGFDKIVAISDVGMSNSYMTRPSPLMEGIQNMMSGVIQVVLMPLGIIYSAKIFHSLKKTK